MHNESLSSSVKRKQSHEESVGTIEKGLVRYTLNMISQYGTSLRYILLWNMIY